MSLDDTNLEWLRLSSPLTVQLNQLAWWMIEWAQVVCVCVCMSGSHLTIIHPTNPNQNPSICECRASVVVYFGRSLAGRKVCTAKCWLSWAPFTRTQAFHPHHSQPLSHSNIATMLSNNSNINRYQSRREATLRFVLSLSLTSSRNVQRSLFVYSEAANEVA